MQTKNTTNTLKTGIKLCLGALVATTLLGTSGIAFAAYPDRPIKLIVPYPPGGAGDQMGRAIGDRLGKALGQPVVVENKPGASTRIAATHVAKSKPDGYTLLLGSNSSMVLNPMLYKNTIQYQAEDFDIVGIVTEMPILAVMNPEVPANTIAELSAFTQANPDKLNFASIGIGNPLHLANELLNERANIEMTHVPYNGSAPALASVMANDTQLMVDGIISSLPLIKDNRLKPLAVMSSERLDVLPDVPTVAESGFPGFRAATWFGVSTPKGTPSEVQAQLNSALNDIMQDSEFADPLTKLGMVIQKPRSLEDLAQYVDQDRTTWSKVIEDNQFVLD